MHILDSLIAGIKGERKIYRIELPIGDEVSDGDRAAIYGWPDKHTDEVRERT